MSDSRIHTAAFYKQLVDLSPDPIVIHKGGKVLFVNPAGIALLGATSVEDVINRSIFDIIHTSFWDVAKERTEQVITAGQPLPPIHEQIIRFDGTVIDVEVISIPFEWDGETAVQLMVHDITERKSMETALRSSEENYRTAIDSIHDPLHVVDKDLRIVMANGAFVEWNGRLGLSQEMAGKHLFEVFPFLSRWVEDEYRQVFQNAQPVITQETTRVKEETYITETRKIPIVIDGKVERVMTIIRDVTLQKKDEERFQKINNCFLGFQFDPRQNIASLITLCGEVMGGDCVLYNQLDRETLCTRNSWNAPADLPLEDNAEGHICYDLIRECPGTVKVVRNLQESPYAQTDPTVRQYNLRTYIGCVVKVANECSGSLCVLYQRDVEPTEQDKKILGIIASAVGIEEERKVALQALRKSEEKHRLAARYMPLHASATDRDGYLILWNEYSEKMLGYTAEEVIGKVAFVDLLDGAVDAAQLLRAVRDSGSLDTETQMRTRDGQRVHVRLIAVVNRGATGEVEGFYFFAEDITDKHLAETRSVEAQRRAQQYLNIAAVIMLVIGPDETVELVNQKGSEILGCSQEDIIGKNWFDCFILSQDRERLRTLFHNILTSGGKGINLEGENHVVTCGGEERLISWKNTVLRNVNGQTVAVLSSGEDVTEKKRMQEQVERTYQALLRSHKRLKQLALKDTLTGLYNHKFYEETIEQEFLRAKAYNLPLSMVMCDVDYFNVINDTHGHHLGDIVLKQLAREIKRTIEKDALAIRYGGEEFVIILPRIDAIGAASIARRLQDRISHYLFGTAKQTVSLKLSIGVVSYPEDGFARSADFIRIAELIIGKVKEAGGDRIYSLSDMKKKKGSVRRGTNGIMKKRIAKLTKRTNESLLESIFAFAKTLELKDHYTGEHVEQTMRYATQIAREIRMSEDEISLVRQASILHDLGKIGISDNILLKNARLLKDEYFEIKKHPQIGADIIRPIKLLRGIIPYILYHHERWDGKGYPHGLKAEEIPTGARIIAIADVYQALISNRPYRRAYNKRQAMRIIRQNAGTQFDPEIVRVFLKVLARE